MMRRDKPDVETEPREIGTWPTVATWRYVGDRIAADGAYCVRFGTDVAPTPMLAPGGTWAYPLPDRGAFR